MNDAGDSPWLDGDAGRLVRPYTVSGGRTTPSKHLDLLSMVTTIGKPAQQSYLEADHIQVLGLCHQPVAVAEIAARLRLPAAVTKILVSDLLDCGAVMASSPGPDGAAASRFLLERVRDGLQRRL